LSLTRFVPTPENSSALAAVEQVASYVGSRQRNTLNPLYLYGLTGTGKTHLVSFLTNELLRRDSRLSIRVLAAGEFEALTHTAAGSEAEQEDGLQAARECDVLIVEDLQNLCSRARERRNSAFEAFVRLFDHRLAHGRQTVLTARCGPARLSHLPARLVSRFASGLIVELKRPRTASRLALLEDKAQRRQLAVSREVLTWLAEKLTGGGRQLDGALLRLETLGRLHKGPLDRKTVAEHFREQADAARPTVERIAQRVGDYFDVDPRRLRSRGRQRNVMLPRQVGMYLTRQLTNLSLGDIGAYFGGRDHSTVLHACRKIERALASDEILSGALTQLQADLA
jgi:chromosomal replication initiator protein